MTAEISIGKSILVTQASSKWNDATEENGGTAIREFSCLNSIKKAAGKIRGLFPYLDQKPASAITAW